MTAHWTLDWNHRPSEEARLLNPVFCGELLARTMTDYRRTRSAGLPLPLAFIVLPLILPSPTRAILPGRANTTLATWVAEHEAALVDLPHQVLRLRPVTREALLFMIQNQAMNLGADGLESGARAMRLSAQLAVTTDETDQMRRSAALLGRWFASQGAAAQILQAMGVTP